MSEVSVLFLGKRNDPHCQAALEFVSANFEKVVIATGDWGEPFPENARAWAGDYIISFLSRWIIPDTVLKQARKASINFHPGSPEYPGFASTCFAIYDGASAFGVTCHRMEPAVDAGQIVAVRRFSVYDSDTVVSLHQRTYTYLLALFYDTVAELLDHQSLGEVQEQWRRKPTTRKDLLELQRITPDMNLGEIQKRVRATYFPGQPLPYIEVEGLRIELKS